MDVVFCKRQGPGTTYANFDPTTNPSVATVTTDLGAPSEAITLNQDETLDLYNFAAPASGQYIVAQFVDAFGGGNPGGGEFRFVSAAATPEPAVLSLLLVELGALGFLLRRRRIS